jgi:dimethylargininase
MPLALTRAISPAIAQCELTHLARETIDVERAVAQHAAYEAALERVGYTVLRLDAQPDLPDSVFVEDTAVVLDEVAVITRPGAESRRAETLTVTEALARVRPVERIVAPGTLDGGDVLRLGRQLFVGRSRRTNDEGTRQLRALVEPLGYAVTVVPVTACLHLKSAVTAVGVETVLLNPAWVRDDVFARYERIAVAPGEAFGANGLLARGAVLYSSAFPATAARLLAAGIDVRLLDVSEIVKAEGAVTCCSVLID